MNDLVYVMHKLKLKIKQIKKKKIVVLFPFDDIECNDEWITKEGDNVEVNKIQGEGDGGNVELVELNSTCPTLDAFDLDHIVLLST